ncbi:MAG: isoprenylcysteine carboxylmethyltransferase family protein [Bacteroidales bacterium]
MNYAVLVTGTIFLILFSWFFSLKHKRYHGIPRFFGFESIFILAMLNLKTWFHDPFSFFQIISWIMLILSAYVGIAGFLILKRKGRSGRDFEATTVLIKSDIYKYIRHPLYLSLILLGTGIMLKDPGLLQLILGAVNLVVLYFTSRIEETEMTERFGDDYAVYMKETKMFIPYIL